MPNNSSKKRRAKKAAAKAALLKDRPPTLYTCSNVPAVETKEAGTATKIPTRPRCHFFTYGLCRFGNFCRNAHDLKSTGTNTYPPAVEKRTTTLCIRHRAQIQPLSPNALRGTSANWAEAPEFVPKSFWKPFTEGPDEFVPKSFWKSDEDVPKSFGEPDEHVPKSFGEPDEHVPKSCWKSFAEALKTSLPKDAPLKEICPYFALFFLCPMDKSCPFVHGRRCDMCQMACLHPLDAGQRKQHVEMCEKGLLKDMEKSFAIQRSRDKACGICHDVVWEKEKATDRRFGILERCNHVFCLSCIRTWRRMGKPEDPAPNSPAPTEPMPTRTTRMCPECRVHSNFYIPSKFWAEGEDKLQVIQEFKASLGKTKCMYFKSGKGRCPFGGMCFYLHATPDGTKVDLPPPPGNRWRQGADGEVDFMEAIYLWDFLEVRVDDAHNV